MSAIHQALLMIGEQIRYWLSQRYPVEQPPEPFTATLTIVKSWVFRDPEEAFTGTPTALSGVLASIQLSYTWPPEPFTATPTALSGTLVNIQINYVWPPEAFTGTPTALSGTLVVIQLFYNNWPPEAFTGTPTAISGTLA